MSTVTIPAAYVEDFTAAVVSDIKVQADQITGHARRPIPAVIA